MYRFKRKEERPKDADDIEFEDIIQRKMSFDSMMFVRNGILAALKKKIDMARREDEVATVKLEEARRVREFSRNKQKQYEEEAIEAKENGQKNRKKDKAKKKNEAKKMAEDAEVEESKAKIEIDAVRKRGQGPQPVFDDLSGRNDHSFFGRRSTKRISS